MNSDDQNSIILRAIDAFNRKFLVVSPRFEILALKGRLGDVQKFSIPGAKCYDVLYGRDLPCQDCPTLEVGRKRQPALSPGYRPVSRSGRIPCLYSYPIFSGKEIEAFVLLDFDFTALDSLEEKLRHANAFLNDLIHNAVDCVIAADMAGKILIFNDSAAEVWLQRRGSLK